MPAYIHIRFEISDRIGILRIDREEKLNALNNAMLNEIRDAVQEVYDNKDISGLIITGTGEKAFAAGADIKEIASLNELNGRKFSENGQEVLDLIENCHKPIIAAVNGYALGGGLELALACHIRMATRNAKFGLPEVTLGILPGYGGTQRLTHLIGKGRAMEMIMTGDVIDVETALKYGIINHVFSEGGELIEESKKLLLKIVKNAPLAIGMIIESVNAALSSNVNGYQTEANCFSSALKTKDFVEGTSAFLEKRTPVFKGE